MQIRPHILKIDPYTSKIENQIGPINLKNCKWIILIWDLCQKKKKNLFGIKCFPYFETLKL